MDHEKNSGDIEHGRMFSGSLVDPHRAQHAHAHLGSVSGADSSSLPSVAPASLNDARIRAWHPKLTVSRLFVVVSTLGLGTAKAAMSYRGDAFVSVTIEWVTTILLFLIFLVLSTRESNPDATPAWLFQYDTMELVWSLSRMVLSSTPTYQSDERPTDLLVMPRHPPITAYRLLVTSCALAFGMVKAVLSYMGQSTEPVTIEWVFGVFITLGLYFLGLYENSSTRVLPGLFEADYVNELVSTTSILTWILIYCLGLAASGAWTYLWLDQLYHYWAELLSSDLDMLSGALTYIWAPVVTVVPIAFGVGAMAMVSRSFARLVGPSILVFLHRCYAIASGRRRGISTFEHDQEVILRSVRTFGTQLLGFLSSATPSSVSSFGRFLRTILIYVVVHVLALGLSLGFIALWVTVLVFSYSSFADLPWYEWPWSALFCFSGVIGIIVGVGASLYVVAAFFSIFVKRRHLLVEAWAL